MREEGRGKEGEERRYGGRAEDTDREAVRFKRLSTTTRWIKQCDFRRFSILQGESNEGNPFPPFSRRRDRTVLGDGRRECVSCGRWSGGGAAKSEFDASTVFFHAAKIMLMNGT